MPNARPPLVSRDVFLDTLRTVTDQPSVLQRRSPDLLHWRQAIRTENPTRSLDTLTGSATLSSAIKARRQREA